MKGLLVKATRRRSGQSTVFMQAKGWFVGNGNGKFPPNSYVIEREQVTFFAEFLAISLAYQSRTQLG